LIGTVIFAFLVTLIGPALGVIDPAAFGARAQPLVEHT
jgi:hypothetical protein